MCVRVCVCVWLHGCVDGRVQHEQSKVRLEKTNDEAHPTTAATSSSWILLPFGGVFISPAAWVSPAAALHGNTSIRDDNNVP